MNKGNRMNKNIIGWMLITQERHNIYTQVLSEKWKGRDHLGCLGIDGRIILK